MIYIITADSNSISTISTKNNTPLGNEIIVGVKPIYMEIDTIQNKVYVANAGSNSISVINGITNEKIGKDIVVCESPLGIIVSKSKNDIYVANSGSNSISVINGTTNEKIGKDIVVGENTHISPLIYLESMFMCQIKAQILYPSFTNNNTKMDADIPLV